MATTVKQAANSRLSFSDLLQIDGVTFYDQPSYPDIPVQGGDISYTVLPTDRVDTVAFKFYGDPTLWWVLALANDWELLPQDMNSGDTIRVPDPAYILSSFFKGSK